MVAFVLARLKKANKSEPDTFFSLGLVRLIGRSAVVGSGSSRGDDVVASAEAAAGSAGIPDIAN